jgi:DNA-binding transcriptional regulator YiaG
MTKPIPLADQIRTARDAAKLTQAGLARALEIESQTVSRWERGEREPNEEWLLRLALVLKVTFTIG